MLFEVRSMIQIISERGVTYDLIPLDDLGNLSDVELEKLHSTLVRLSHIPPTRR
jgi:hypothetical protein